jgi:N-methylhydantoinase B
VTPSAGHNVDPVTYQIVHGALVASTRAMAAILRRSARSTIIRETQDFSTAVLDAAANLAAQSEAIPLHLNSLGYALRFCLDEYPAETLRADEMLMVNDPYHGGQHLPDIQIFAPVIRAGRVIAFVGNLAHHTDISGGIGSMNPTATDVFQEGIRIPPLKLRIPDDLDDGPVGRLLRANSRLPENLLADLNAQVSANRAGVARLHEMFDKHGLDTVLACMAMAQDFGERTMRRAIEAVPDGVYTGEDFLDTDGFGTTPLRIFATVSVRGADLDIDFTGTDPRARGFVNSPMASTISSALTAVRAVLGRPDTPTNGGSFRPVRVHAPLGCLLNPGYPAPVRLRMNAAGRAYGAVLQALGKAMPERAAASGFDTTTCVNFGFLGERGYRIYMEPLRGGLGGATGSDAVSQLLSNSANTPVEAAELDFDFMRIRRYALRPDSGGAGTQQGGLGCVREFEITRDGVEILFSSDRAQHEPWSLDGGAPGTIGTVTAVQAGRRITLPPNGGSLTLNTGDRLRVETGGGGGLGDPARRDAALVRADIAAGRISPGFAATHYPQAIG